MKAAQQVNLFPPELLPKHIILSFRQALLSAGVSLLLLLCYGLWQQSVLSGLHDEHEKVNVKVADLDSQTSQMRIILGKQDTKLIDASIIEIKKRIEHRKKVQALLGSREFGNQQGFSRHLVALADQHIKGISLNDFSVTRGGTYITLSGFTRQAELVPQYLQALRSTESLVDVSFGSLMISREAKNSVLEFSVGINALQFAQGIQQ